jgi:outer membrane protein OmpU
MTETEGKIMKKILIATTALVATAGVAAADVSFSGYAAMGAIKTAGGDFEMNHNVDLYISASTQADNGLSFYAGMDYENNETTGTAGKGAPNASTGSKVGLTMGDFRLEYGNVDGAADKRTTEAHRLFAGIDFEYWGGVDNDDNNNILRADYTVGDINLSASNSETDNANGLGISWAGDLGSLGLGLGAGYEGSDDGDIMTVSATISSGAFAATAIQWKGSGTGADSTKDQTDLSVQYAAGGVTVALRHQMNDEIGVDVTNAFATYDLGGGAKMFLQTGERINAGAAQEVTSLGVQFTF